MTNYSNFNTRAPVLFDIETFFEELILSDKELFDLIEYEYLLSYGGKPGKFLAFSYNSWKNGTSIPNPRVLQRIFILMPKFLLESQKIQILNFELKKNINGLLNRNNYNRISISRLNDIYSEIQTFIKHYDKGKIKWLQHYKLFSIEEIESYLNLSKYSINELLILSYKQTYNDYKEVSKKLLESKIKFVNINYEIGFLKINIVDLFKSDFKQVSFESLLLDFNRAVIKDGERILLEQAFILNQQQNSGNIDLTQAQNDLEIYLSKIKSIQLNKIKGDVEINIEMKCSGGKLMINWVNRGFTKRLFNIR
jgi:hypothetical protein